MVDVHRLTTLISGAPLLDVEPTSCCTICTARRQIQQESGLAEVEVSPALSSIARCRKSVQHRLHATTISSCNTQQWRHHLHVVLDHNGYKEQAIGQAEGLRATCVSNASVLEVQGHGCLSAVFSHLAHRHLGTQQLAHRVG